MGKRWKGKRVGKWEFEIGVPGGNELLGSFCRVGWGWGCGRVRVGLGWIGLDWVGGALDHGVSLCFAEAGGRLHVCVCFFITTGEGFLLTFTSSCGPEIMECMIVIQRWYYTLLVHTYLRTPFH